MAVCIEENLRGQAAVDRFMAVYRYMLREIALRPDRMGFAKGWKDMENLHAKGRAALFLSIESGAALGGDIGNLKRFYDLGVRMMNLTWNEANELGDGIKSASAGGLTPFGKQVIGQMAELGMLVDVSHLSEKGFWDVAAFKMPIIASHSNLVSVYKHPRNLTNEQFAVMVKSGGGCGIALYPLFINGKADCEIGRSSPSWTAS
jgi:membrane dipeptidase